MNQIHTNRTRRPASPTQGRRRPPSVRSRVAERPVAMALPPSSGSAAVGVAGDGFVAVVEELRETSELHQIPGEIIDLAPATARSEGLKQAATEEERPEAPIPEGTIWDGRYRIERALGEGGMGNVLLASDLADGDRPLALKVLHPSFREVATPYFMREYSIQRTLRHPSIARALDLGFDLQGGEEVPYFAMPFVPGVPLTTLLDSHPPLEQVVHWTIDILEALDAIHRAGFLHRDVKPGNILVDPRVESGTAARLIDFGIAVALSAEPEDFFIGTPEFSAPERIECLRPFDARSDLYAVGLIMHELIEGAPAWPGRDPEELLHARRETPPRAITHPCPDGIKALITDLLAADPKKRPPSAAAVIERLRSLHLGHEPLGLLGGIESVDAFAMRLSSLPIPAASYARALSTEAPVLVIHVPPGHDGGELLDELGDRRALSGVRVVRLKLEGKSTRPLGELQGALDVLRRLRERNEPRTTSEPGAFRGLAGAAVLLTRLHRQTLLVIDGLDQADEATLMVLGQSFLGAQNRELEVVATMSTTSSPKAPTAIDAFLAQDFVKQVTLEPLTVAETGAFVARALGPGLLDPEVVESLHQSAHGRPLEVSRLLVEAFKKGILIRRPDGYLWLQTDERRDEEPSGLLVVDLERELAERMSLLIAALPEQVVERFLGDTVGFKRMLAAGVLVRDEAGQIIAAQRDACAWRYTSLEPRRRNDLHHELASVLAKSGTPGLALLVAEQLVLTARPASAAPWFVIAARDARIVGEAKRAHGLLARATSVLERDTTLDAAHGEWRLMVLSGRLELAQSQSDVSATLSAASELLDAAVEQAHLPSIERALAAELDHAEESWNLHLLMSGVDRLLLFQQSCGGPTNEGLRAWQRAVEAAVEGDPAAVFRWVSVGVKGLDVGLRLSRWLRTKLLVLQATVAVHAGYRQFATKALDALAKHAARERGGEVNDLPNLPNLVEIDAPPAALAAMALSPLNPTADLIEGRLVALRARWLRLMGEPVQARAILEAYRQRPGQLERPAVLLELAQLELEASHLDEARTLARRAHERGREIACPHLVHAASSLMAEAAARRGEADVALEALEVLMKEKPPGLPQTSLDTRLRWLATRLSLLGRDGIERGHELFDDAEQLARLAARVNDVGATARAVFLLVQIALKTRRPMEALANADWLEQLSASDPVGAPPRHAVEWLLASVHYQLKWFKSANAISRRAMETLRVRAQETPESEREAWLASDRSFIGFFR